jgi:hypothetical protein
VDLLYVLQDEAVGDKSERESGAGSLNPHQINLSAYDH